MLTQLPYRVLCKAVPSDIKLDNTSTVLAALFLKFRPRSYAKLACAAGPRIYRSGKDLLAAVILDSPVWQLGARTTCSVRACKFQSLPFPILNMSTALLTVDTNVGASYVFPQHQKVVRLLESRTCSC